MDEQSLEDMVRRCREELEEAETRQWVPAPHWFERVAILCRRAKDYPREVLTCEAYIAAVERFYAVHGTVSMADVRAGPTYQAIVRRLDKARQLGATAQK